MTRYEEIVVETVKGPVTFLTVTCFRHRLAVSGPIEEMKGERCKKCDEDAGQRTLDDFRRARSRPFER